MRRGLAADEPHALISGEQLVGDLAADGQDLPRQAQLPGEQAPVEAAHGDLAGYGEDRHGDGQVEPGPGLPHIAGREAHGDRSAGHLEPAGDEGATDAAGRLRDGAVREPEQPDPRQPAP